MQSMADLNWRYHDAAFPLSFPNDADHVGLDDELLPEKTSKEKETDPYAYYFDFADKAKAKLEARGLWVKDETDGKCTSLHTNLSCLINANSGGEIHHPLQTGPDGFDAGFTVALAAQEAAEAGDEAHHRV